MHVNITSAGLYLTLFFPFNKTKVFSRIYFFIAGIIALLEETDQQLVGYALKQLNSLVDMFWAEISDSITIM